MATPNFDAGDQTLKGLYDERETPEVELGTQSIWQPQCKPTSLEEEGADADAGAGIIRLLLELKKYRTGKSGER